MTTRDPSAHFGGEVSTEIDNYRTSRNFAYLTGGLTPELKANISAYYTTQGEGRGKNLVTGSEIHKIDHDFGMRSKRGWAPSRSEEHTSELQSLMRISYDVLCLQKKKNNIKTQKHAHNRNKKPVDNTNT